MTSWMRLVGVLVSRVSEWIQRRLGRFCRTSNEFFSPAGYRSNQSVFFVV